MPKSSVYVDDRIGSKELAPLIAKLGLTTKTRRLEFGDFAFWSPDGLPEDRGGFIGIERKTIRDMVSSIQSGRYSGHQLPGMLELYDVSYLIVEGRYKRDPYNRCLCLPTANQSWTNKVWKSELFDFRALDAYLNTIRLKTPVQVIKTENPQQTAMEVYILWHWFTARRWSSHKGHEGFHSSALPIVGNIRPSGFRQVVKELPYIGWERSKQVEEAFGGSLRRAFNAKPGAWSTIDGVTPERAAGIVDFVVTGKWPKK